MKRMIINRMWIAKIGLLLIFLAGCSNFQDIVVAPNPEINENELYSETIYIRNCADLFNEKRDPLLERAPIVTKVFLPDKAISDETSEEVEIPTEVKEKLEAAIIEEYQNYLDEKQTKLVDVDLVVPAYTIRIFEVLWKQECICSVVIFGMNNEKFSANFSYKLEYPTLTQSMQNACTA